MSQQHKANIKHLHNENFASQAKINEAGRNFQTPSLFLETQIKIFIFFSFFIFSMEIISHFLFQIN